MNNRPLPAPIALLINVVIFVMLPFAAQVRRPSSGNPARDLIWFAGIALTVWCLCSLKRASAAARFGLGLSLVLTVYQLRLL